MTEPTHITDLDRQIGRSVRAARKDCSDLTQADLQRRMEALGVKVHNSLISQVEGGTRRLWFTEALAIAAILDVPIGDLPDYEQHATAREVAREVTELRTRLAELEGRLARGSA